ncbi:hypothetical protein HMPREF3191_00012 [Veillonellaceae bacterium DNF00626]|nr:hypothetical protein HMPREF3191_00012 [Veillonellaceae bacterium DNF00626]
MEMKYIKFYLLSYHRTIHSTTAKLFLSKLHTGYSRIKTPTSHDVIQIQL